jgi:catechol 2,3-dioxygenase-like lactoylglutathione lyase family enzyme
MKLEVVVIPVSDVVGAAEFYGRLGWRRDADIVTGDRRVLQFTPPGSPCSIIFATGVTLSAFGGPPGGSPANLVATALPRAPSTHLRLSRRTQTRQHGGETTRDHSLAVMTAGGRASTHASSSLRRHSVA